MTLKEIDSSKLLFDIHSEDLVEQFKSKIPEFENYKGKVDEKKVVQYIVLLADVNTPLRVEKPDWWQRKYTAAMMVKLPMTKKEFSPEAEAIVIGENEVVNNSMVAYICSYGLPNYTLLMAFFSLLSFETQKVFGGKGDKNSQSIIDKASDRIQNLTRDFFKSGEQEEYYKARQALYARVEKDKVQLRPEQMIRAIEDTGELPEGCSPFPSDYKINLSRDMVFLGDK